MLNFGLLLVSDQGETLDPRSDEISQDRLATAVEATCDRSRVSDCSFWEFQLGISTQFTVQTIKSVLVKINEKVNCSVKENETEYLISYNLKTQFATASELPMGI